MKGKWKNGKYLSRKTEKENIFRSSWEQRFMVFLDECSNVQTWEYESLKIEYQWWNRTRIYKPDFLVTLKDNTQILFEIKPEIFWIKRKNIAKRRAAEEWCNQHGIIYSCISLEDIKLFEKNKSI